MRRLRTRDPLMEALKADLAPIRNPSYRNVTTEGRDAALDGRQQSDNPYPAGSQYASWWSEAFNGAKPEIKSVEKEFRKL